MNEVARIKYALDDQAFFGIFHTEEIKARRAARMREDAQRARQATYDKGYVKGYAQGGADAYKESQRRERALIKAKDREAASLAADVAGGLTMAATLVGIFMML